MRSHAIVTASAAIMLAATAASAQELAKLQIGDNQRVFPESITSNGGRDHLRRLDDVGFHLQGKDGRRRGNGLGAAGDRRSDRYRRRVRRRKGRTALGLLCRSRGVRRRGGAAVYPRTYSLADGSLQGTYPLPERSFCNDIAPAADGTAYIADTSGARLMRLKPGATELETWHADASLGGVDGLSFDAGGELYINNVMTGKLHRVGIGAGRGRLRAH